MPAGFPRPKPRFKKLLGVKPGREFLKTEEIPGDSRPTLGSYMQHRRGTMSAKQAAWEMGVHPQAYRDMENHLCAKAQEIEKALVWVGRRADECQLPRIIIDRVYSTNAPVSGRAAAMAKRSILNHLLTGETLATYENPDFALDSKAAKKCLARWLREDPEFLTEYLKVKEVATFIQFDNAIEIADDASINPAQAKNMIAARMEQVKRYNRRLTDKTVTEAAESKGFGAALEALERRKNRLALPPQNLQVIDLADGGEMPAPRHLEPAVRAGNDLENAVIPRNDGDV